MRFAGGVSGIACCVLSASCAPNMQHPTPFTPHATEAAATPLAAAARFLDSAIAQGAAPGAVIGVSSHGRHWYYGTGRLGQQDATRPDSTTLYDLASMTKVVALTSLVMQAVREGKLDLTAPISRYVPAFQGAHKDSVTLRHLLTHSAGLPAWRPLFLQAPTREAAFALADTTPLDTLPGIRMVYSDLGIIIMTQAVEGVLGHRLDTLFAERVATPLGLTSTRYLPPPEWLPRIAPTEQDPWRGRVIRGEVHDENASRLDGVSGHAGLFSDAVDLLGFGEWLLRARATDTLVHRFTLRPEIVAGSSRALGWDTPSGEYSSAGHFMSDSSVGHTGFTGTSIWIDPTRDLVIVVLSNRVHPSRANNKWGDLGVRGGVADRVVRALEPGAIPNR